MWDTFWLVLVLVFAWKTLRRSYFRDVIVPADPAVWLWLHRRFGITERGLLALYRGLLFYGGCRIVAWTLYARVVVKAPWDPSWGGPDYIEHVDLSTSSWGEAARSVALGALLFVVVLFVAWKAFIRRLWNRGVDPTPVPQVALAFDAA
jgi:hypothetical protein